MLRRRYQENTWVSTVFFFSGSEGGHPAFHPRQLLMQVGDIESNLGPPCAACSKAIRKNTAVSGGGARCVYWSDEQGETEGSALPVRQQPRRRR